MRTHFAALAVAALALAGCGTTGEDEATVSNTPAPLTSKTTSSAAPTSETSSSTSEPEAPTEQQAEAVPAEQAEVQAPTVTGCANHGGTALMSDGSTAYSASCDENAGGPVPGNVSPYGATAAPTFVRCYLADGTALMSDGSTTYMDSCNESAGGPMLLEDGTSIYDHLNTEADGY